MKHLFDAFLLNPDAHKAHVVGAACGVLSRLGIQEVQIRRQSEYERID